MTEPEQHVFQRENQPDIETSEDLGTTPGGNRLLFDDRPYLCGDDQRCARCGEALSSETCEERVNVCDEASCSNYGEICTAARGTKCSEDSQHVTKSEKCEGTRRPDDYIWTKCGAHSPGGEDEVLVIESGNPIWCASPHGADQDAYCESGAYVRPEQPTPSPDGAAELTPVQGAKVKVDDLTDCLGGDFTDFNGWLSDGKWSTAGKELAPLQTAPADRPPLPPSTLQTLEDYRNALYADFHGVECKYKSHVVRRDLTHGSLEEHVEGDMYTTIEGSWFSMIKGHLWNTYYGKTHEDFAEDFSEVFRRRKTEIQEGSIVEINRSTSREYYFGNVHNEYGRSGNTVKVTDIYHGPKTEEHYNGVQFEYYHIDAPHFAVSAGVTGEVSPLAIAIAGIAFNLAILVNLNVTPLLNVDLKTLSFEKTGVHLGTKTVQIEGREVLGMDDDGIRLSRSRSFEIHV